MCEIEHKNGELLGYIKGKYPYVTEAIKEQNPLTFERVKSLVDLLTPDVLPLFELRNAYLTLSDYNKVLKTYLVEAHRMASVFWIIDSDDIVLINTIENVSHVSSKLYKILETDIVNYKTLPGAIKELEDLSLLLNEVVHIGDKAISDNIEYHADPDNEDNVAATRCSKTTLYNKLDTVLNNQVLKDIVDYIDEFYQLADIANRLFNERSLAPMRRMINKH